MNSSFVYENIRMETPLRGRSGGHAGTAPTVSFGWITRKRLMSFRWIVRKWLFCLCGIAWKNMMEFGRGGHAGAAPTCFVWVDCV